MTLPGFAMEPAKTGVLWKHRILPVILGGSLVIVLPYIHLGFFYRFWVEKDPVDRDVCTCSCWDTLFKGSYQAGPASYKHVYFNLTSNTMQIWVYTVLFVLAIYEAVRFLASTYMHGNLRYSMFLLFVSVLYPHYYAWWSVFNYINDEFYTQWNHQTFFTVTELMSSAMVLFLCDRKREVSPLGLLFVISIAALHIIAAGGDQFVKNVLLLRGQNFQIFRDLGFMIPDLLNITIPLWEWWNWCQRTGVTLTKSIKLRDFGLTLAGMAVLLVVWYKL